MFGGSLAYIAYVCYVGNINGGELDIRIHIKSRAAVHAGTDENALVKPSPLMFAVSHRTNWPIACSEQSISCRRANEIP